MHAGTSTGLEPRAIREAPHAENSTDTTQSADHESGRCACGRPVDGYDARRGEPTCARCAQLCADGGRVVERDGNDDLGFEYVHDPEDPEKFLVRCTDCGEIGDFSDRGDAHSRAESHGLNCAPTGVTPVSSKRVVSDGGQVVRAERTGERYAPETLGCATCGDVAERMTWGNSERRVDYRCRRCECGGHLWLDTDGTVSNRVGPVFRAHRSGVQSGVNA
ncbi:hypothetical protein [Halostella salina]|uniref:hypothetical protein n=1 Tax=Halostella salina TaxID=1547897 RepID=UPI000EF777E2|nr:hypothetical protein [Halostella salina]